MKPVTTFDNFPSFANGGTRQAPGDAKYSLGFVAPDTLPAEWGNYFFHGATKGISDLNSAVRSIWLELESVLTSYGITPSAESTDQILTALSKIYPKITTCDTGASTATKDLAISGNVLKPGDLYVITMTYGNTAANPTLRINSVAATEAPICDADGNALGSGAWKAGDIIKVLYTGTKYLMSTHAVVNALENGNMNPVTSNAVYNAIQSQFDMIWPVGSVYTQYPAQKSPNELWGDLSTWEVLDYGGAFFRANGGNADNFEKSLNISSVSGATIVFSSNHGLAEGSILYDPELNESRYVLSVTNATTVVVNAYFTNPNLTNVLITQNQSLPNITGTFYAKTRAITTEGAFSIETNYNSPDYHYNEYDQEAKYKLDASKSNPIYGSSDNVTPTNYTYKIWKRTA